MIAKNKNGATEEKHLLKRCMTIIRETKEFEKKIGFKETDNFQKYSRSKKYNIFYYHKKADIPFSYLDPVMHDDFVRFNNVEEGKTYLARRGKNIDDFETLLYSPIGVSGGTLITKQLLETDRRLIAYTALHEDCHDNFSLPIHIDEAASDLIGEAGSATLFGRKSVEAYLQESLDRAIKINTAYEKLAAEAEKYKAGKTEFEEFNNKKNKITLAIKSLCYNVKYESGSLTTALSQIHTYTHYFPLIYKTFYKFNGNLGDFFKYMMEISADFKNRAYSEDRQKSFLEQRADERQIENILERLLFK